jgi:RNA polymerase sigma-70 factor (ECF subfamily)
VTALPLAPRPGFARALTQPVRRAMLAGSPMPDRAIADAFLAAVEPSRRDALATPELGEALAAIVATARAAWPAVRAIDASAFARWIGARLPPAGLADLPARDLYLACACAAGDPAALAAFDAEYLREVDIAGARLRAASGVREEARQVVRDLLFVPRPGRPPAIATYAGRGDLRGWVRVIATREVVRVCEANAREVPAADELLEALSPASDPGLEQLKRRYRDEFATALREAIARLTPRERTLLSYHLVDGLGADGISEIFHVHRATAARWLARARGALLDATRARLGERLGIGADEVDSIIRLIRSRIDVSVRRALGRK